MFMWPFELSRSAFPRPLRVGTRPPGFQQARAALILHEWERQEGTAEDALTSEVCVTFA